jgi:hypothetical protein
MLMRAEVVDDFLALLAVDHRRVEAPASRAELERAHPSHRLASE